LLGLVMLCGTAFGSPAPIITTTPTNGPTTITVHARTTDGKLPVEVSCTLFRTSWSSSPIALPSFAGSYGDWVATNVPPGSYRLGLTGTNYIENPPTLLQVFAGTNYTVDFVLSQGGWISGRVELPARGQNRLLGITAVNENNFSSDPGTFGTLCRTNGTFYFQPMPPGTYTLYVNQMVADVHLHTAAELGSVSNITVIVGQETTNVFIPTKLIIQTNGASGR
jgi:hypothetical protein